MDIRIVSFSLALAIAATAANAGPSTTGALPTPANRIVGSWSNVATTGPCNAPPTSSGNQTLVFSAGGTFFDNPRFPPGGIGAPGALRQRSIGMGTWTYDPKTGEYRVDQQFDWYLNNAYDGYQTIHRTIVLSSDGNTASGPVLSIRYNAAGVATSEICGNAVSTRL